MLEHTTPSIATLLFKINTPSKKSFDGHPFMYDEARNAVLLHSLNPNHYLREEVYARMDQGADLNNLFGGIDNADFHRPAESFCNYSYKHVRSMMTTYFYSTVSPDRVAYVTAAQSVDGRKLLKDGY